VRALLKGIVVSGILALVVSLFMSCGAGMGIGFYLYDDEAVSDSDVGLLLYNGLWRGDYVYYRGRWYYRGLGTPYIYDGPYYFYDPYYYDPFYW